MISFGRNLCVPFQFDMFHYGYFVVFSRILLTVNDLKNKFGFKQYAPCRISYFESWKALKKVKNNEKTVTFRSLFEKMCSNSNLITYLTR